MSHSRRGTGLLTTDLKGAFDSVLLGRLVRCLREQGWPDKLVKWAISFTTNRTVHKSSDSEIGPSQDIVCGLPQASPISPILFTLYISPLLKIEQISRNFGYVDEISILETSSSLDKNSASLSRKISKVLEYGRAEAIYFDPAKTELQYFSHRRSDKDPRVTPSVTRDTMSISKNYPRPYTRWLGIYFDKTLSFKWHI